MHRRLSPGCSYACLSYLAEIFSDELTNATVTQAQAVQGWKLQHPAGQPTVLVGGPRLAVVHSRQLQRGECSQGGERRSFGLASTPHTLQPAHAAQLAQRRQEAQLKWEPAAGLRCEVERRELVQL